MADKLGFGILGAGLVCPFHAKSIQEIDGAELVAICDVDRARVEKRAAEFGAETYYSLDEMLRNAAVDVVCVTTPNHLHHDAVLRCAAAGKHIICEKPPAMSLAHTDEMVRACAQAGVKFMCMVQCRVRGAVQAIRRAVASGRFGRLLHADAYMKWYRPSDYYHMDPWRSSRRSGAGVTIQHAFHYIDLLQYLAGPVKRVEAKMSNLAHATVELEDTLCAFLEYASGAYGVLQASTALWPGMDLRIEVHGEQGTAGIVGEAMDTWKFKDERAEDEEIRRLGSRAQATAAGGAADFGHHDHRTVIEDMVDAVRKNRGVIIPVESVRHTLEIALAMYASARFNKPIELPLPVDAEVWT